MSTSAAEQRSSELARRREELASASAAHQGGPEEPDLERLLVAALRLLAARAEAGEPAPAEHGLTPTEALTLCSQLLEAVDLEVFELALWQSWGRAGSADAG